MLDTAIVEVAIGLALIFLVFSLVVSGIYEGVAKVLAWRAKSLWAAIHLLVGAVAQPDEAKPGQRLLNAAPVGDVRPTVGAGPTGASAAARLYAHPLVGGLEQRAKDARTRIDKIESGNFARALIDTLVPDGDGKTSVANWKAAVEADTAIPDPLKRQLVVLLREGGDDFDALRSKIETWFDAQMATLTRGYRKRAHLFTLVFGLTIAVVCNVDAIEATQRLYRDDVTRSALVSQAGVVVDDCDGQTGDKLTTCLQDAGDTLGDTVTLPVGWQDADVDASSLLGWILSGLAISQGAPFWYDILKRAMAHRRQPADSA